LIAPRIMLELGTKTASRTSVTEIEQGVCVARGHKVRLTEQQKYPQGRSIV